MTTLTHQNPRPINDSEDEPLLGAPVQAARRDDTNIYHNLVTG